MVQQIDNLPLFCHAIIMASYPIIKPIKTKEFHSKQSKYEHCAQLPMRAIVLGPSGSGKTVLLQNMILDV